MSDSVFTSEQWMNGLLPEITSARMVLDSADRLLREKGSTAFERNIDAVLATYSIGVERLMKLALGTAALSRRDGWPKDMGWTGKGWGHALDKMDERLRDTLRDEIHAKEWEQKELLRSWICTLDNDQIWHAAVRTFRNYADKGRYHHLDQIACRSVNSQSSREMWNDVEHAAIDNTPSLKHVSENGNFDLDFDQFEYKLRCVIADSVRRWITIVCLCGFHGVLGDDWKRIGAEALPSQTNILKFEVLSGC